MDTRKRLEKVLTTALGQSFEECPNAKKVVIQQTLFTFAFDANDNYDYSAYNIIITQEARQKT